MRKNILSTLLFALLPLTCLWAQSSPYSLIGIGNFAPETFAPQQAMGGLGVAYGEFLTGNIKNPALLAKNKNTIFDAAAHARYVWMQDNSQAQEDFGANVDYFSLTLSISKRWSTAFGLMPYTQSNFRTRSVEFVEGTPFEVEYKYQSTGGINTLFWAHGVQLTKSLSVGVRANYMFGALESETQSMLYTADRDYQVVYYNRLNTKGWAVTPGVFWKKDLGAKKRLNIGATYTYRNELKTKRFESIEKRSEVGATITVDTLYEGQVGTITLPNQWALGMSIEEPNKWMIGVELSMEQWSDYRFLDENSNFNNTMQLTVGGVYTPNFRSVDSFFERVSYRVGLNYRQLPYQLGGNAVEEFGINFGMSMPVGVNPVRFTYLHWNIGLGQRGTVEKNGLQERFVQLGIGVSMNDLMWFKRPKYD
ncbi:MAG: hypothetical protein KatS3mg033_0079 [Thermonema sp.]|uniref:hypothetical protein n=1 Tax=Thermonema sp. TaxID=2231181 RepID=UPI0021DBBDF4|nr:hypothetical protein [Thermonema sp.]GIV38279.1 MAG: hypothetical protein KatS3mg033_0079 [Thermonema sp.]